MGMGMRAWRACCARRRRGALGWEEKGRKESGGDVGVGMRMSRVGKGEAC